MIFAAALLAAVAPARGSAGFDVIVHSATPGGVMAAVAAAREGADVALLEPGAYIGGAISGGLGQADYGVHASVIGGLSVEFFQRVAAFYGKPFAYPPDGQCGKHSVPWVSEPHVAEQVLVDMLRDANVTVLRNTRVAGVQLQVGRAPPRIASVTTADGRAFRAAAFIDGSYEGSLMKLAGVSYTWGREANTTYNETAAGRLPTFAEDTHWPYGDRTAQLPRGINPYADASNTTLIAGVWGGPVAPVGGADDRVGSYDWRLTLTDDPANAVPLPEPADYDPAEFELARRAMRAGWKPNHPGHSVPNQKTDWKMFGTFGEYANAQWEYPNATWERQQEIVADYKRYALALLHFFRTDPEVPAAVREAIAKFGLCRDEYNRSAHWMPQLYVRSALRMVGDRVLTQQDVVRSEWHGSADGVGVGAYTVDIPGPVQTIVEGGEVINEGALKVSPLPNPRFCAPDLAPFPLPYGIMVPKRGEVDNLLVAVAVSASHVAFNSVRMEPTWMILGHAAGAAAAAAVRRGMPPGGVGAVDVAALRARLRAGGQVLDPPPAPAPTPAPGALSGDAWYAWRQMWNLTTSWGQGGEPRAIVIVATQKNSVLKREYTSSKHLPPAEVRKYPAGERVALKAPPEVASDDEYWLVHVSE